MSARGKHIVVKIDFKVQNIGTEESATVRNAIVDVKGKYMFTWVPKEILKEIGIKPQGNERFRRRGRVITRKVGTADCIVRGKVVGAVMVFGEKWDRAVLGHIAMESLAMRVNPKTGRIDFRGILYA